MQHAAETCTLQIAIVGSGPSGFYAAEALLRRRADARIDVYDRLPTPFGLVRGGVAPDHPKIKQVALVYDKIARSPGFAFVGNVEVGRTLTLEQLRTAYHVVILACGASADRRLGIAGEDLPGSHTATEFVGWYNGQPDYRDRVFDFSGERAVIIGQGNVAGDVARILATPVDDLRKTDIAEHALEALSRSRIGDIYLIGRRGPAQIKFTAVELKELGQVRDCVAIAEPGDLDLGAASAAEIADPRGDEAAKNVAILRSFTTAPENSRAKRLWFRFFEAPGRINGIGKVESVSLTKTRLEGPPFAQIAVSTLRSHDLPCSLVFRSVGYKGVAAPGLDFDEQAGIIVNRKGRCLVGGKPVTGVYVTGWIKRGPTGVIGTNRADSVETVESILEDISQTTLPPKPGGAALKVGVGPCDTRIVSYAEWQKIDLAERVRGQLRGKPREKFTLVQEMITAIDGEGA
jgi:ferredoxin/flavodoxin---NADP+ reductase